LDLVAAPLMIVLFKIYGLYNRDVLRISHSTVDDIPWLLHGAVIGTLILRLSKLSPAQAMDFTEIVIFGSSVLVFALSLRFLVRHAAGPILGGERQSPLAAAR
jgi:hypothetical protein